MKKHIGLFIVVVASITACLLLTKQKVSLNTKIQPDTEVFTASSSSEQSHHKPQSSSQTINPTTENSNFENSKSENSTVEAVDPNSGLTKSEAEILVAWAEPRGYRGEFDDYDSMNDETLTALAN